MTTESLMAKEASRLTFHPSAGFLHRANLPSSKLSDQFIWIAKLDAHSGKRPELLSIIKTHARNVERDEEGCLTFLVLESKDDKDSVTLLERYESEAYFRDVHAVSKSMATYREKTGALLKERSSGGFVVRAGFFDKREVLV